MKASFSILASLAVVSSAVACGGEEKPVVSPIAAPGPTVPTASPTTSSATPPRFDYPATRVAEVKDVLFGTELLDPYRWLEDGKAPEVTTWLSAQDAYARAKLAALPGRAELVSRLKELFYVESRGVPQRAGKRYFYSKREAQKEKSVVYVSDGSATAEGRVLIDPQTFAADGTGSLGGWEPSQDGKYVAYLKKANNSDEATLFVRDVATGKDSAVDVIEGAKYGGMSWTPKGDGFYYTWLPPADGKTVTVADRPGFAELRFHKLGTDPKKDVTAHPHTGDAKTFLQGELSRDGHWLFVVIEHGWTSSDVFYKDMRKGDKAPFVPLAVGQKAKYSVTAYKDRFYVRTDDGAPNGRVVRVDPKKPARDAWEVLVPEPKDATLDGMNLVGGQLSIGYLKDVQTRIEMRDLDGKVLRDVALPTVGTASVVYGNPEDTEGFYTFTSFTYPTEIHAFDVKSGKAQLHYRLKVPVDPSKFAVEQLFATSKDGTRVPYFVVHAKDFKKDGSAKALVYGYGGFLATQKPGFTSSAYPWLERGGIYVVTNLRGGAEYGEAWHEAGMRRKKQNVFDDLYAIMEKLASEGYTKADRIALRGASNGGLLVATAVTQRPDLFAVGLCGVPLVDMVRFHLFGSGKTWVEEYGSSEDAGDFAAIAAYSPYQHVVPGKKYPSLLVLSADADDRVDPMHARKFAARMQAASRATPASGPVLLRVEKHSGHGGADLVSASVEKLADELAFALAETAK